MRAKLLGRVGGDVAPSGRRGDMLTIAYVADIRTPNAWYRTLGPMGALARAGHRVRAACDDRGAVDPRRVDGCDVVFVHRLFDKRTQQLVAHAQASGIAVVWDNDDDVTAVPKQNIASQQYRGLAGATALRGLSKVISTSDVVTTPSGYLAERLRSFGAVDVRVVENFVRDDVTARDHRIQGKRVVIGWLAGGEHHVDVDLLPISAACERLLDAHHDVEVVTIGARLRLNHARYRNMRDIHFLELPKHMAGFDIGIAPIADIPFNHCRSNIKLKEYAVLGVPWLASPVGPYLGHGERQGGRLVADDDWFTAMEGLVTRARERAKLAKRAAVWGQQQRIGGHAGAWEIVADAAIEHRRTQN